MKVRYYGHAGQPTGYGIAAEHMIRALLTAGVDVEIRGLARHYEAEFPTIAWSLRESSERHPMSREVSALELLLKRDNELDPNPDACIVHTLPADCPKVVAAAHLTGDYPVIAYTTWEYANKAPSEILTPIALLFNEVWTPSSFSMKGFIGMKDDAVGVRKMPHAFNAGLPRGERVRIGDPAIYRFYYVGAWNSRKNPAGVIRAFVYAFRHGEPVELLLHMPGADGKEIVRTMCSTGIPQEDLPRIRHETKLMSARDVEMLHQGADCFVTATRGEGWNLPAFEAVLEGRHVIAPQSQGHDEFLGDTSARRYSCYPMPAQDDVIIRAHPQTGATVMQPFGVKGATRALWLEPDLLQLAELMRLAFDGRISNLDTSQINIDQRYGYLAVGAQARKALEELR